MNRRSWMLGSGAALAASAVAQGEMADQTPQQQRGAHWSVLDIRARLGISLTYFYYNYSHLAMLPRVQYSILERVRAAGIPIVDIADYGDEKMYVPYTTKQPETIRALAKQCREVGLQISGMHSTLGANPRPPLFNQLDIARKEIDLLLESGGHIWLTHLTAGNGVQNPENRKAIESLLKSYENTNLVLTVENTKAGQDVAECVAFANAVDHPKFGVTIDIGHCVAPHKVEDRAKGMHPMCDPGGPTKIIQMAAKRLVHMHLHDFHRASTGWGDHHVPFLGNVRWVELFDALEEVNYRGTFLFETTELYENTAVESVGAFPEMLQVVRDRQELSKG